ncbi:hypothetical protein [Novosphingobium sp. KACC 22771]|uniref:hypothetical protein n=1 Tax=Novosphingobium sp. KACC 22771 TaxID=3025670 RepID=UPI0023666FF8|nr:hypothetical protein [Novosphingobium sp. KACC 22771]WDF73493.1 hypothetical protein PQ467_05460 [Novosphingobium sp. KACC 22771]
MRKCKIIFGCIASIAVCACSPQSNSAEEDALNGYADLKLGMSYNDALSVIEPRNFNPVGVVECAAQIATKGCALFPESNLSSYRVIEGVPYAASLSFNKFSKLTDIELVFERSTLDSKYEKVSKDECLSIAERTIDAAWNIFGNFSADHANEKGVISRKTPQGHTYLVSDNSGFLGSMSHKGKSGRRADLMFYYIVTGKDTDCHASIEISDRSNVERYKFNDK